MLSEALPSALGAAIYPPALLFMAFLLVRPQPRKRALIVLAGAAVITLSVGFAVVLLLQNSGAQSPAHRPVSPWIDVGLGALLILFAVVVYRRPPRGPKEARERRDLGLLGLFAVGLFLYAPSPFYLASLHAIAKGHAGVAGTVLGVILVAAIYMLMIEIPIIAHAIRPEATIRGVTAVNTWLSRHGRTLICAAAGAFGVYLLVAGIVRLL